MYFAKPARCMLPSREIIRPWLRCLLQPSRALTTQASPTEKAEVHLGTSSNSSVTSANASYQSIKRHDAPKPQLSVRYPYFVRRTTNGNLPVYTDNKGNGFSDVVHIQRVEGDVHKLKDDLLETLLPPETGKKELERLRKRFVIKNSTTLSLVGGRWRTPVIKWLTARGF